MATTSNYTAEAKEQIGEFVQQAGKSFLVDPCCGRFW